MATTPLDPALEGIVRSWPGVTRVDLLRTATVESPGGPVIVFGIENPSFSMRPFLAADVPKDEMWAALQNGAIAVSEPYANNTHLPRHGAAVTLITDEGPREFPVAGIYYDYVASQGTLTMSIDTYRRYWHDQSLTALSLHVAPGTDVDAVVRGLSARLVPIQQVFVQPNRELREDGMAVFDRTFAITGALQLLATVVAFIAVLSALLSLELERRREMGILRAVGLTARQLWAVIALETGLMGGIAGLLAMPTGLALSWILVYIINRRSFGWTLQMQLSPEPFVEALLVAVVAALLAGVYPAYRIGRAVAAESLRYE
jgi:putative ABC transport system permease protein